jgi:hypothetical protein
LEGRLRLRYTYYEGSQDASQRCEIFRTHLLHECRAIVPLGADIIRHSIPNIIQYPILIFEIVTYANIFVGLLL